MTYTEEDLERIAAAITIAPEVMKRYSARFEAAAFFYKHRGRAFEGRKPAKLVKQLGQIRGNARRLLKSLGVNNLKEAPDGPGDLEILQILTYPPEGSDEIVVRATSRVGRLTEILEGIDGARVIEGLANQAIAEVGVLAEATLASSNVGELELDNWVGEMMDLYRLITGRKPARSVSVGSPDFGISTGPLIRFLQAAGRPLELDFSEDAWGARIQRAQARAREKKPEST